MNIFQFQNGTYASQFTAALEAGEEVLQLMGTLHLGAGAVERG